MSKKSCSTCLYGNCDIEFYELIPCIECNELLFWEFKDLSFLDIVIHFINM